MIRTMASISTTHLPPPTSHPPPQATWDQAANSGSITSNVFLAACLGRVRRVVFASSNHLMGGHRTRGGPYLDPDDPASPIRPDTEVLVGAKWLAGSIPMDSTPYASAKLFGERLAGTLARAYPATSFVSLRIGWCQPGENTPATLSASGSPITEVTDGGNEGGAQATADPGNDPILTRDWCDYVSSPIICEQMKRLFSHAHVTIPFQVAAYVAVEPRLSADHHKVSGRCPSQRLVRCPLPPSTPTPSTMSPPLPLPTSGGHVVLNANSDNTRMRWDISETRRVLGYQPQDNVADHPIP